MDQLELVQLVLLRWRSGRGRDTRLWRFRPSGPHRRRGHASECHARRASRRSSAGKSLAQIASSTPGKSVEGLKTAILSAEKTRLERAESSGLITSRQEQEPLGNFSSRIEALLQRTGAGGSYGGQVQLLSGADSDTWFRSRRRCMNATRGPAGPWSTGPRVRSRMAGTGWLAMTRRRCFSGSHG